MGRPARGAATLPGARLTAPIAQLARQRQPEPEPREPGGDKRSEQRGEQGLEQEVGHEERRGRQTHREEDDAGDRGTGGRLDDPLLVAVTEANPVVRRWEDEETDGRQAGHECNEEDDLLELVNPLEPALERHRQEEGEQNLHARQGDPQLLEQLLELSVDVVLPLVRHPPEHTAGLHPQPLLETNVDPQPLRQFEQWFAAAREAGIGVPEAVALATATADGRPSARMVLLKGFGADGFVFYTSYESRKARELTDNPHAALLFHWDVLGRQVRIEGPVDRVSRAESESYFATRPRGSQIGAWASRQSERIADRHELEAEARRVAERFEGSDVPPPSRWGGYRLAPDSYEFWQHRDDRLHDRLRYLPNGAGGWSLARLGP